MMIVSPILKLILRIATLTLYALTALAAFGGHFDPMYFTIPAILTLTLPYLAILTLVVAAAWLVSRRFSFGVLGVLVLFASWGAVSQAVPLHFSKKEPAGARTFTLMTFNSLHLNDIKNPQSPDNRAVRYIIDSGADIVCLQELINWYDPSELPNLSRSLRDSLFMAYPYRAGNTYSDLKVISKYPIRFIPTGDKSRWGLYKQRHALFEVNIDGHKLNLINMHLTSYSLSDEERELVTHVRSMDGARKSLHDFKTTIYGKLRDSFRMRAENVDSITALAAELTGPVIVCGDFNDVPGSWSYRLMLKDGFKDAFAETSFGPVATYNQHMFLFHIDQVFYRGDIEPLSSRRLGLDTSDHYPLELEFAFTDSPKP